MKSSKITVVNNHHVRSVAGNRDERANHCNVVKSLHRWAYVRTELLINTACYKLLSSIVNYIRASTVYRRYIIHGQEQ